MDITCCNVKSLVDWLIEVHLKFKMVLETIYITVQIVDRLFGAEISTSLAIAVGWSRSFVGKYIRILLYQLVVGGKVWRDLSSSRAERVGFHCWQGLYRKGDTSHGKRHCFGLGLSTHCPHHSYFPLSIIARIWYASFPTLYYSCFCGISCSWCFFTKTSMESYLVEIYKVWWRGFAIVYLRSANFPW